MARIRRPVRAHTRRTVKGRTEVRAHTRKHPGFFTRLGISIKGSIPEEAAKLHGLKRTGQVGSKGETIYTKGGKKYTLVKPAGQGTYRPRPYKRSSVKRLEDD